jgi:hypothetical protein
MINPEYDGVGDVRELEINHADAGRDRRGAVGSYRNYTPSAFPLAEGSP